MLAQHRDAADLAGLAADQQPRGTGGLAVAGGDEMDGLRVEPVHLLCLGDVLLLDEDGTAQRVAMGEVGGLGDLVFHVK